MSAQAKMGPAIATVLLAGLLTAGCSGLTDQALYGGTPAAAAPDATFPDLRSVPQTAPQTTSPEAQQQIAGDLAADRAQARYADQLLRAGTAAPAAGSSGRAGPLPPPLPALDDIPAGLESDRQSLYQDAPVIPMPARGGHRDMAAVFKLETAAREATPAEAAVVTEDGAPAAAPTAGADGGPEVVPAPTKRVTVKPVIGQATQANQP